MAPTCLYALPTTSGHAPDGTADGVLGRGGGSPPKTWIRASVSSWTVCGATWRRRMHRYITSQRFSIGFGSGERQGQSMESMPSSCSSSHKGADTGPAAGLLPFYGPIQLSLCNGLSPGISPTLLRLCWGTQQSFLRR